MRLVVAIVAAALIAAMNGAARAEILITVDKSAQRMTVKRDGALLYTWPVSTGRTGYSTPSGNFTAFRMEAEHYSKEWDDAPMPHSIFFTQIGHAIHGSYDTRNIGTPVSHGCVRLSPEHAATLYSLVQQEGVTKTKVALTGDEQVALAHRGGAVALRGGNDARPQPRRPGLNSDDDNAGYASREPDTPDPWSRARYVDPNGPYAAREPGTPDPWSNRSQPRYVDPNGPYAARDYDRPGYDDGRRGYPPYPDSYRYPRRYDLYD
jgi:L,D-transpeptidase catalytic domain